VPNWTTTGNGKSTKRGKSQRAIVVRRKKKKHTPVSNLYQGGVVRGSQKKKTLRIHGRRILRCGEKRHLETKTPSGTRKDGGCVGADSLTGSRKKIREKCLLQKLGKLLGAREGSRRNLKKKHSQLGGAMG